MDGWMCNQLNKVSRVELKPTFVVRISGCFTNEIEKQIPVETDKYFELK